MLHKDTSKSNPGNENPIKLHADYTLLTDGMYQRIIDAFPGQVGGMTYRDIADPYLKYDLAASERIFHATVFHDCLRVEVGNEKAVYLIARQDRGVNYRLYFANGHEYDGREFDVFIGSVFENYRDAEFVLKGEKDPITAEAAFIQKVNQMLNAQQ